MEKFSVSLTLGKASDPHGANIGHNNREFIAWNVDQSRTHQNCTYVREYVEDVYQKLFGKSVELYNAKQKQKCRRIEDYYEHICSGRREEAFYEIIVQFGDCKTTPCGSERGEIARNLLDEYMRGFSARNPRLYVFNAVLHMDEASPHLHIDFIPFYLQPRKRGLRVGVSMKQALIEQGFTPDGKRKNQLVAWEQSERNAMEDILHRHGYEREDKNAHHKHKNVETFKADQDRKAAEQRRAAVPEHLAPEEVQQLYEKLYKLENENQKLRSEKQSLYKPYYYSDAEQQTFVQEKMKMAGIPFRETENGFEAQECYRERIRHIEKQYKPPRTSFREKLRDDVDYTLMQSTSLEDFLGRMEKLGYEIKRGKYLAIRPKNAENFIRLKSLGEQYSEYGLKNRLIAKQKFDQSLEEKIKAAPDRDKPEIFILQTIRFYTVKFTENALPMRRREQSKPFSWKNDAELDKLLALNKRINDGATMDSLRDEFARQEQRVRECETALQQSEHDLNYFYDLKEKIEVVFEGKASKAYTYNQAWAALQEFPNITKQNYRNIDQLIQTETEKLQNAKDTLQDETKKLKEASDTVTAMERVLGGTYVQNLIGDERRRRESRFIPNGVIVR